MKDRIKSFFDDRKSYYEPEKVEEKGNCEDQLRKLKKENENLRGGFKTEVSAKFKSRRSIRKFSSREVPWEVLHDILESGLNAPAAGNVQNYNIIVIKNKKMKHELGKLAFQQYWLSDAPVLFVVVREDYHLRQMYPDEGGTYAIQNSAAVIENILLLAHFYDLGACWVEAYDNEVLKELLGVPMEKTVDAIIPIGYPLEAPHITKDPMVSKVFYEKFGNKRRK